MTKNTICDVYRSFPKTSSCTFIGKKQIEKIRRKTINRFGLYTTVAYCFCQSNSKNFQMTFRIIGIYLTEILSPCKRPPEINAHGRSSGKTRSVFLVIAAWLDRRP